MNRIFNGYVFKGTDDNTESYSVCIELGRGKYWRILAYRPKDTQECFDFWDIGMGEKHDHLKKINTITLDRESIKELLRTRKPLKLEYDGKRLADLSEEVQYCNTLSRSELDELKSLKSQEESYEKAELTFNRKCDKIFGFNSYGDFN